MALNDNIPARDIDQSDSDNWVKIGDPVLKIRDRVLRLMAERAKAETEPAK